MGEVPAGGAGGFGGGHADGGVQGEAVQVPGANLLAHLDLRCRQGLVDEAEPLRSAALRGYGPCEETARRIPRYEAQARQRLAAVNAFRTTRRIT